MLRTNTNAVKNAVRRYILDNFTSPAELGYDPAVIPSPADCNDFQQVKASILAVFRLEYGHNIRIMGTSEALKQWMCGLPSVLHTLPLLTFANAAGLVAEWLQAQPGEASKHTPDESSTLALHLVARELLAAR